MRQRQEDDRVSANAVTRFAKTLQSSNANRGILVSTSYFTEPAHETANQEGIELMNGEELARVFTKDDELPE